MGYYRRHRHKKILEKESVVRQQSMNELERQLKSKDACDLILHGDQKEFLLGVSKHQKFQVEKKEDTF